MPKEPLHIRLYFQPHYVALARYVSYGGVSEILFFEEYKKLCSEYGQPKVAAAVQEILLIDKTTCPATVKLTTEARTHCRQLLGPAPESSEYEDFWIGRTKPEKHQPPPLPKASEPSKIPAGPVTTPEPEVKPPEAPKAERTKEEGRQEEPKPATDGIAPEGYAKMAKEKNRRALMCMLRDAREKLAHHGKRSFMGKEARKEIEAAEAEIQNRGYAVPDPGQETAEWTKAKK